MGDFFLYDQGAIAVIETATLKVHGPYEDEDDAQYKLYLLEQQGISAVAIQVIGETNV